MMSETHDGVGHHASSERVFRFSHFHSARRIWKESVDALLIEEQWSVFENEMTQMKILSFQSG